MTYKNNIKLIKKSKNTTNYKATPAINQPRLSPLGLLLIALGLTSLTACQPVMTGVKDFGSAVSSTIQSNHAHNVNNANNANNSNNAEDSQITGETMALGSLYRLVIEANRMPCDSPKPMQCMIAEVTLADNTENEQPLYLQIPYTAINNFRANSNTKYVISASPFINQQTKKASGEWQLESILSQKPTNRRK